MCGRFTIGEVGELVTRFSIDHPLADMPRPRYDIAPTQDVPIVIGRGSRSLVMMRWGLVPFWAKDLKVGNRMINARSETVSTRPAYRVPLKDRRCIVPTTGFYEWKRAEGGKVPYLVRLKDEGLFGMAGLYDRWLSPQGEEVLSFTILTTAANDLMLDIHDRMPVILAREDEELWVRPEPLPDGELARISRPFPSEHMEAWEVSKRVNDVSKDDPQLVCPARKPCPTGQWF